MESELSQSDADKWNTRYRAGAYSQRTHPSAWLRQWQARFGKSGSGLRAVDIGCGAGRNALYLARLGWSVVAIDVSLVALQRLAADVADESLAVDCIQADLESSDSPLPAELSGAGEYDLALMVRYTNLPLLEKLRSVLRPDGHLLVELHLQTEADVVGPSNPKFRVAPGELRQAARGFEILDYREGLVTDPDGRIASLAQLIARS